MARSTLGLGSLLALALLLPGMAAESTIWEEMKLPEGAANKALYGVYFLPDGKLGWIVGADGLCLATADGGATWEKRDTGSGATLRDVRFNDATHGWAVGDGDPKGPPPRGHVLMGPGSSKTCATLLITTDGGKSWQNHWVPTNFELWAVETGAAPQVQIGPSGGEAHLDGDNLRCADGKGWSSERVFRALFDIRAQDAQRWIAVGSPVQMGFFPAPTSELFTQKKCRALFSKDGGKTWAPAKGTDALKGKCLRGLAVKKDAPALAVGDGGAIMLSADAGETWNAVESSVTANLKRVAYAHGDGKLAVAIGAKGAIIGSTDDGKTWNKAWSAGAEQNLFGLSAAGASFVAVSKEGKAFRASLENLAKVAK